MSDEREKLLAESDDEGTPDVEAHKYLANDEGQDEDDDVEAHIHLKGRNLNP